tara:strand:- start:46 stop:597 length:552 start_codon:yes stop_codon:yes gene_type:complete
MKTKHAIYKMLTEDTGKHMCDSGGATGRHWQKNQKKSIEDFINEPYETLETDGEYKYYSRSLFHHLNETCEYLEAETEDFNNWVKRDLYNYDNPNGRAFDGAYDVQEYLNNEYHYGFNVENTCNFENDLDQGFIYVYDWDAEIIALSVHNGADCRGGYTNFKLFKIDESFHYMYTEVESGEVA